MESKRSGAYEFVLVTLLVLFWGSVGLNRVGIGVIFPEIVPEFHMAYWQASLLVAGTSVTWRSAAGPAAGCPTAMAGAGCCCRLRAGSAS